jgi:hypothetical protein
MNKIDQQRGTRMNYFSQALSDFTHDVASGGAIRHLADQGYTVQEIYEKLDFPTPFSKIQETVWKHYVKTGVILLSEPRTDTSKERVSYVKEYGSCGRTSFRRVVEPLELPTREYLPCDFGRQIYKDRAAFEKKLSILLPKDRDYILGLPWPLQTAYHVADERMKRIQEMLQAVDNQPTLLF